MSTRRYWSIIEPLLPNKPRGVPRQDDRKVLNGIYWRIRTGSPWADIPERYGPATTCSNRFRRWAELARGHAKRSLVGWPAEGKIGVWDRIFEAVSRAYDGDLQMIDSTSIRVHQHGGNGKRGVRIRPRPRPGTEIEPSAWGARAAA